MTVQKTESQEAERVHAELDSERFFPVLGSGRAHDIVAPH